MYCENCGRELDNDIKVCPDCGFEVKNNNLQTKNKHKKSENKKISKSIILVIILGAIAAILFIVVDIKNGGSGNDSDGITAKEFISKFDDEYNKQFGTNISFEDWQKGEQENNGRVDYGYTYHKKFEPWSVTFLVNSESNKVYSVGILNDDFATGSESYKKKIQQINKICLSQFANLSSEDAEEKIKEYVSGNKERIYINDDIVMGGSYSKKDNLYCLAIGNLKLQ